MGLTIRNGRTKAYIIMLLCFIVLVTSFPNHGRAAKKDFDGENLNFAPTVDFEVKEKKKIDVIVDVGNTSYTVDQINSMVNEKLRPQLQGSGIDYKIHVEKSSEGATRQYYFKYYFNVNGSQKAELWYYDILSKTHNIVKEVSYQYGPVASNFARASAIIDPNTNLIALSGWDASGYITANGPDKVIQSGFSGYMGGFSEDSMLLSMGYDSWFDRYSTGYTDAKYLVNRINTPSLPYPTSVGGPQQTRHEFLLGPNGITLGMSYAGSNGYGAYYTTYKSYKDFVNSSMQNPTAPVAPNMGRFRVHNGAGTIGIFKETGDIIHNEAVYDPNEFYPGHPLVRSQSVVIRNLDGSKRTVLEGPVTGNSWIPTVTILDGNRFLYSGLIDKALYLYEDYNDLTKKTKLLNEPIYGSSSYGYASTVVGNHVFYNMGNNNSSTNESSFMYLNVDTGETNRIYIDTLVSLVKYPDWYSSKQRKITDILNEVPYRADAEKFYVRIDDQGIPHLDRESNLASTITALSKQQINYISIGNANNEVITKKIQSALGQTDRYNISEIQTAFQRISTFITERKEVDLHVLVAQSGQTITTVKSQVESLVTSLKAENIIVKPHYVIGVSNSLLQGLLNDVQWNDDKNSYVLLLHTAAMNDMNQELSREDVIQTLGGHYAHYIHIGSSLNQATSNGLIQLLEGKGKHFNGGVFNSNISAAATYIRDTAVLNPKRVSDTLVLQYNPLTGQYSSEITVQTFYEDFENDRKRNERFKTTHDPTVFENHSGVMEGIGQYQNMPTTTLTKVGLYEMVVQVQDEPIADDRLSEYWHWSKDSLSRLRLFVHRAPIADFSAVLNASRTLKVNDYSYDLDRMSRVNKGIVSWVWKWKQVDDLSWTDGQAPGVLATNTDYLISLKVKDIDGAWSTETMKYVTTKPYNQPPVALFVVEPATISHTKTSVITDLSYDPDGDTITAREWQVTKDKQNIWSGNRTPTSQELQAAATSKGLSKLGDYKLQLRVKDSEYWSEWYSGKLEIVNYAPIANYEPIETTYRDTLNTFMNTTGDPDLDGDKVSYEWKLLYKDKSYSAGTTKNSSFTIKSQGLGKAAVGTWQLELKASDPLGAFSYMSYSFDVLNQAPISTITSGRTTGYIKEPYAYTSSRTDADTEDVASLQSYWRLTSPSGNVTQWSTQNISITYSEKGDYGLENWVVDQLGATSDIQKQNIKILNQAPIPGFTMNPNPTYRGVDVNFVSQATDFDGYIDKFMYEYISDNGSIVALSSSVDFSRSFNTIGILNIRQTVTDNDGAKAFIIKPLTIVNRIPTVEVTNPTGTSPTTATIFASLTPTIYWKMTDADNDMQVNYEVTLKSINGEILQTSQATTQSAQSFDIPSNWNLIADKTYRITVKVFDGYDWSQYATDKYFKIITNQRPEAGFVWSPSVMWEGDNIRVKHQVDDSDGDTLLVQYKVTAPDGAVTVYPHINNSYTLTQAQYSSDAFIINRSMIGKYKIEQTVSDGKSDVVTLTQWLTVNELGIIGEVIHTDQWEQYRLGYNQSAIANGQSIWNSNQFYAGEKFILKARTTNTGAIASSSNGITYASEVTVSLLNKYGTILFRENAMNWKGELWNTEFSDLKKGMYDVIFEATYSNGVVKQHTAAIEIIGKASSFVSLHRWK